MRRTGHALSMHDAPASSRPCAGTCRYQPQNTHLRRYGKWRYRRRSPVAPRANRAGSFFQQADFLPVTHFSPCRFRPAVPPPAFQFALEFAVRPLGPESPCPSARRAGAHGCLTPFGVADNARLHMFEADAARMVAGALEVPTFLAVSCRRLPEISLTSLSLGYGNSAASVLMPPLHRRHTSS